MNALYYLVQYWTRASCMQSWAISLAYFRPFSPQANSLHSSSISLSCASLYRYIQTRQGAVWSLIYHHKLSEWLLSSGDPLGGNKINASNKISSTSNANLSGLFWLQVTINCKMQSGFSAGFFGQLFYMVLFVDDASRFYTAEIEVSLLITDK